MEGGLAHKTEEAKDSSLVFRSEQGEGDIAELYSGANKGYRFNHEWGPLNIDTDPEVRSAEGRKEETSELHDHTLKLDSYNHLNYQL